MTKNLEEEKRHYAEEIAISLEKAGIPPMAGRIWGWLLVSEPPHQTSRQLAEAIGSSPGSISTMTNLLMQIRVIERVSVPGQRQKVYRLKDGWFEEILKMRLAMMSEMRGIAERGLTVLSDESTRVRKRLIEFRDFYAFFEKEFPSLVKKWHKTRERKKKS